MNLGRAPILLRKQAVRVRRAIRDLVAAVVQVRLRIQALVRVAATSQVSAKHSVRGRLQQRRCHRDDVENAKAISEVRGLDHVEAAT